MMIQMFQKMKTKYMQKYKELSFFISLFNFDKKRENTWSTVRSAMRTFVAVVLRGYFGIRKHSFEIRSENVGT
jgi:hypothetical protein